MKFELLPNEILIECFEYLDGLDICYSFDQLNQRFYQLIRNISLCLDFQHVQKSIFDKLCIKILSNPIIKNHVRSLKLSNNEMTGQIQKFLSLFSFEEFPQLQSLTLIGIKKNNVNKLITMLPLISGLCCFRLIDPGSEIEEIYHALPTSKLDTLFVSKSFPDVTFFQRFSSIKHLTLSYCTLNGLCELFKYIPMLEYLSVSVDTKYSYSNKNQVYLTNHCAIQLKTLIVRDVLGKFQDIEIFLKYMVPNIKMLIITIENDASIIDPCLWQHLITSSLLYLDVFKFKFSYSFTDEVNDVLNKFEQFQSDFWHKQHHWYTEYSLSEYSAVIYTIPYLCDTYTLTPFKFKYSNTLMNNSHTFNNVKDLLLYQEVLTCESSYHFSNVISLTLENHLCVKNATDHFLQLEQIKSLKLIVNLSNIKHLTISSTCHFKTTSVLLQILKQTKQLSSITIDPNILPSLYNDQELCNYLRKMIKKLDVYKFAHSLFLFKPPEVIDQFCQTFSNIEQLKCNSERPEDLLILLTRLSKLSSIKALIKLDDGPETEPIWLEVLRPKLDLMFNIRDHNIYVEQYEFEIFIWIGRNFIW